MTNFELNMKTEILMGDFRNEDQDEYVKMLEADSKKNRILKIGISTIYIVLLIVSLIIV